MEIKVGDYVRTPRFLEVRINEVFGSENEMRQAGYTEPTHYMNYEWSIRGKSIGINRMIFAACRREPEVTEMCANCMRENTFVWDVDTEGYKAYCPFCGEPMMLCDACKHAEDNTYGKCTKECFRLKDRSDAKQLSKEKLVNILNKFFSMEDTDAYWLMRSKSAFTVGTVTIDDFEEFTDETIDELAVFIINELVK